MTRLVAAVGDELGPLPGTVLGVGLVAAAASAARLLATDRPDAVVLIGTAGRLGDGPRVGTVIVAGEVALGSAAAALGLGYVPRRPGPIAADPGLVERIGLPTARVLTNLAITTDPALAERFAAEGQVEHMEAYAVAYACADAGVPFAAVLGITNEVGPGAHAEWLRHRLSVQAAVQAVAARIVGG